MKLFHIYDKKSKQQIARFVGEDQPHDRLLLNNNITNGAVASIEMEHPFSTSDYDFDPGSGKLILNADSKIKKKECFMKERESKEYMNAAIDYLISEIQTLREELKLPVKTIDEVNDSIKDLI